MAKFLAILCLTPGTFCEAYVCKLFLERSLWLFAIAAGVHLAFSVWFLWKITETVHHD